MEDKNGLNDIILNKSSKNNSTKKILLTIATFAIILIIVVVVMNQVSSKKESNLPHPPEISQVVVEEVVRDPEADLAAENVPLIDNADQSSELVVEEEGVVQAKPMPVAVPDGKAESERIYETVFEDPEILKEPDYTSNTKPKSSGTSTSTTTEAKQVLKPAPFRPSGKYDAKSNRVVKTKAPTAAASGHYYIQVGSFATYAPSKTFLDKIAERGYTYTFHKVTRSGKTLTKVLVGPFKTQASAREALPVIRKSVESGAFLTKI
jgi:DedD protein